MKNNCARYKAILLKEKKDERRRIQVFTLFAAANKLNTYVCVAFN